MIQQTAKIQAEIVLPPGKVLVDEIELLKLKKKSSLGEWKDLKWFQEKVGIKKKQLLEEMILQPFREELDVESGGFVHYPSNQGDPYKFLKNATEHWLENNFAKVYQLRSKSKFK